MVTTAPRSRVDAIRPGSQRYGGEVEIDLRSQRLTGELLQKIENRTAKVAVLGQGYVGLVVAMRASEAGFPVVGLETDESRVKRLAAGDSYIEDVPDNKLRAALERGYVPTSDPVHLAGFDVAVVSVPTPLREGMPDLSYIESAAQMLAANLSRGSLVVLESTTYPGTTEEMVGPVLEAGSRLAVGVDFLLGYSPERIDPGNAEYGLHNTPKIVSGVDAPSREAVEAFFGTFVERTVATPGCGEAELAKIIENTFRHVNIALVNEIAMFAHDLGIDASAAIEAAATKPFGFMKFTPGPGVGGHCLPIDPTYLSWRVKRHLGENFRFIELANDINEHMPHYVVRRIQDLLNRERKAVNGSQVVVLGLAYKPNVGDWRESPSLPLVQELVRLGAHVTAVDPYVESVVLPPTVTLNPVADEAALAGSDLAVIVTDHDSFDYDALLENAPLVLDTRNRLTAWAPNVHRL